MNAELEYLINALNRSNITINIQSGQGNTFYAGPVQNNNRPLREERRQNHRCCICGVRGDNLEQYGGGDYVHTECWQALESKERRRNRWEIVKSDPSVEPTDQTLAKLPEPYLSEVKHVEKSYIEDIDERYSEKYKELVKNGIKHRNSEDAWIKSWSSRGLSNT